jgi:ketosteroid isomerase-like protein
VGVEQIAAHRVGRSRVAGGARRPAILGVVGEENVERSYAAYGAFNRRDWGAALAIHADDVEVTPLAAAVGSSYRGADGLRRYWEDLLTNFPDFTTEVLEVRDLGALTLCAVRFSGHGAGSAAPFEQVVWQLANWRDGRISWWRSYASLAEATSAADEISA